MSLAIIGLGLLPVLCFGLLDGYGKSLGVAIAAAVLGSLLELLVFYSTQGKIEPVSLISLVLFLVLGMLSYRRKSRIYIRLQPALVAAVVAMLFGYHELFGVPMLEQYLPLITPRLSEPERLLLAREDVHAFLASVFRWFTVGLVANAVWLAYAAVRYSTAGWVLVNVVGPFVVSALAVVIAGVLHWLG